MSSEHLTLALTGQALEDFRWYLEDYLRAPFGVWEDRGPKIREELAGWGDDVFASVFGVSPARDVYYKMRDAGPEVVIRSADPALLAFPWELMRDRDGPVALRAGGISRTVPGTGVEESLAMPGGRLRILLVISRPAGISDVGYQMVARPLLSRLDAVHDQVDLTVLRPPAFEALEQVLTSAVDAGQPFHVVHFDGHGLMQDSGAGETRSREGMLAFERPGAGGQYVAASRVAAALARGRVPVTALNACHSGAMGKNLESSVATSLLRAGCVAVVAMAYSVYAVAAAEFMAAFYESLFTGASIGQAVTAGRRWLSAHNGRPSPRGRMPLDDWLVPVLYTRGLVSLARTPARRLAPASSRSSALERLATSNSEPGVDPLAAADVFVGRDDLFYEMETAALFQRTVILTGPGGTGKTELAKGFARWQRQTGGVDDPSLVFWHSFEPGLASFGLDGMINGIGINLFGADFPRHGPHQRMAQVKQVLGRRRALLIWDNFETVRSMPDLSGVTPPLDEPGCAQMRGFLDWVRSDSCSMVVITSRAHEEWLGPAGRVAVGGLNRIEAVEYADRLLERSTLGRGQREHRAFGDLLEWLDGHPLAMRLTLPTLGSANPGDLLDRLRGTASLAVGGSDAAGRLSSLEGCVRYSCAHLDRQTQRLLPVISLLSGVADADTLARFSSGEAVPYRFAGATPEEWASALRAASYVGLLTPLGGGSYRIHVALPGYLAASWHSEDPAGYGSEREACETAMCVAVAELSFQLHNQTSTDEAAMAYASIELRRRTLGSMLGYALDQGMWFEGERIVQALDDYWEIRGLVPEAELWADRVLNATSGPGQVVPADTRTRSLWLHASFRQANRHKDAGRLDQAAAGYHRILTYLQDQPRDSWTSRNIAVMFHQLGIVAQDGGRPDVADDWCRKALAIKEELGDRPGMAVGYHQLGNSAFLRGQLDEADGWYRKALVIKQELGDRPGTAVTCHQLSVTAHRRKKLDEADGWCRRALAVEEELGNRLGLARGYHQLGMTVQDRGRLEEADSWYRRALTIREEFKDRSGAASDYHQLGITAYLRRRLDESDDWYRKALALEIELKDQAAEARTYFQLGLNDQVRGRLDEAGRWYRKALVIEQEMADRPSMAITYAQLGLLAEVRGRPQEALEHNIRSVTQFDRFPHDLTGTAPKALTRLARKLGPQTLIETWRTVTGRPLPQKVLNRICNGA